MAEIDLISSHAPWSRTPRLIDQAAVGADQLGEGQIPAPRHMPAAEAWALALRAQCDRHGMPLMVEPLVMRSNSTNPVEMPVIPPLRS